jgi:hypothetical protein
VVDIYRWHLANPGKQWPPLIYWGHYVAHDNNRDSMGLTLQLTRNVLNTFVGFKAQVLHDLHESVPYLYDNTVGDGPYNAWIDPILADEWQMMGWNNVSEMTKFGMPGVFTHGTFDTWSPSYLMFIAAMHNGISRLYETFGNGGADTEERTLRPMSTRARGTSRTRRCRRRSGRSGTTTTTNSPSADGAGVFRGQQQAVPAQHLKAKRSIEKPLLTDPGIRVHRGRSASGAQAELLRMLQDQGCRFRARRRHHRDVPEEGSRARRPRGRGRATDRATWRRAMAAATVVVAEVAATAGAMMAAAVPLMAAAVASP